MVLNQAGSIGIINQGRKNDGALKRVLEQLSTGKRINRSSDDAAMMSVARELEKQVRGFQAAEGNIAMGAAALFIQDSAASGISDNLQRQRELALQASNDTLNPEQRAALNAEYQQLTSESDRIAKSAQFNSQTLLDSNSPLSDGTGVIQAGANATTSDQLTTPAADLTAASLGTPATDILSSANAQAAISSIDNAMKQVNQTRTNSGALANRMESALNNAQTSRLNTTSALSQAEDLDYAQATAEQARVSVLQQTNIRALLNFTEIARNNILGLLK